MFESAKLKVGRALVHIDNAKMMLHEFLERRPIVLRKDGRYPNSSIFLTLEEPIPENAMLVVGDAIHNLRAALDHCVWELLVEIDHFSGTDREMRNIQFPAKDSQSEFERRVGALPGVQLETEGFMIGLAAYPEGAGENLFYLHQLDIADKHHALVPAVPECVVSGLSKKMTAFDGTVTQQPLPDLVSQGFYSPIRNRGTHFGNHYAVYALGTSSWNPRGPELEFSSDYRVQLDVLFSGDPFRGQVITGTIEHLAASVTKVVTQFERFVKVRRP